MRVLAAVAAFLFAAGCGDVTAVRLDLVFENAETEAQVRWLELVVRETSDPADRLVDCEDFVNSAGNGRREGRRAVPYPSNQALIGGDFDLTQFNQLTYIVLAYDRINSIEDPDSEMIDRFEGIDPIAGACDNIPSPVGDSVEVDYLMVDLNGGSIP